MDESRRRRRAATPRPTQVQKDETLVTSTLGCAPRGKGKKAAPLVLDGEDLRLVSVEIDGVALAADAYEVGEETLTIAAPPKKPFTLKTVVAIEPEKNTQLSGLYASSGNLCTQCEAEGFRRITYFYDRPDCMASYTRGARVSLEGPRRRRGRYVDIPRRRVAAAGATWIFRGEVASPPRARRGDSAETGRGAAAGATWIFRGDGSPRAVGTEDIL